MLTFEVVCIADIFEGLQYMTRKKESYNRYHLIKKCCFCWDESLQRKGVFTAADVLHIISWSIMSHLSQMPRGSDDSGAQKLYNTHLKTCSLFEKPRMSNRAFIIQHFADKVQFIVTSLSLQIWILFHFKARIVKAGQVVVWRIRFLCSSVLFWLSRKHLGADWLQRLLQCWCEIFLG